MTVNTFSAARRVCADSGWRATNLQLQKILYLAHMIFSGQSGGMPLIDGRFEAWDYGPVEPTVYAKVAMFGRKSIRDVFLTAPDITGTPEATTIDEITRELLRKSPAELVDITHWDGGAWARNYSPGVMGIKMPQEHVLDEYKARVGAAAAAAAAAAAPAAAPGGAT